MDASGRVQEFNPASERVFGFSRSEAVGKELAELVTSWNKEAERLFGYSADEIIGKPITVLVPPDRHNEELGIIERLRQGERVLSYETVYFRKDGTALNVSLAVWPIKDETGNVIGASKIARDITERIRAERRRTTQYAVTNLLAASWTLAEVATELLEAMALSGDWAFAAIWTYVEAADGLPCRNAWHEASERVKKSSDVSLVITIPESQALPGRVRKAKTPT